MTFQFMTYALATMFASDADEWIQLSRPLSPPPFGYKTNLSSPLPHTLDSCCLIGFRIKLWFLSLDLVVGEEG